MNKPSLIAIFNEMQHKISTMKTLMPYHYMTGQTLFIIRLRSRVRSMMQTVRRLRQFKHPSIETFHSYLIRKPQVVY